MTSRTLSLEREALSGLTTDELAGVVAGAQALPTTPVEQCPQLQYSKLICYTRGTTCACD